MRYSHEGMLPQRAFKKLGKHLTTFEGGNDEAEYIPMKPAKVTSGFGTAVADPESGKYKYTLDPRLAAMRDIFYGATGQFMPSAEQQQFAKQVSQGGMGLFGTGQEYLNQALAINPQEVGQQYYRDIQDLMAMDRAEEEARLASTLFKTGRTGVGAGVEGGYINPEQFALLKAREQANKQLGIEAEQLGRSRQMSDIGLGQQLMGSGLTQYGAGYQAGATPYQTMAGLFGLGTNIESLGFQPLQIGMQALPIHGQIQAGRQAVENANASGGKGGAGLLGTVADIGLNYASGGLSGLGQNLSSIWSQSPIGGGLEGIGNILQYGYGGVSPFAGVGGIEYNPYLNWRG